MVDPGNLLLGPELLERDDVLDQRRFVDRRQTFVNVGDGRLVELVVEVDVDGRDGGELLRRLGPRFWGRCYRILVLFENRKLRISAIQQTSVFLNPYKIATLVLKSTTYTCLLLLELNK